MGTTRPWTPEEEQIFADAWMSSVPTRDIVRMMRRYDQYLRAKARKMGMPTRRTWVNGRSENGKKRNGCVSIDSEQYPGPHGWYCTSGPPCVVCDFHERKTDPGAEYALRVECRRCHARLIWDAYVAIPDLERRAIFGGAK